MCRSKLSFLSTVVYLGAVGLPHYYLVAGHLVANLQLYQVSASGQPAEWHLLATALHGIHH